MHDENGINPIEDGKILKRTPTKCSWICVQQTLFRCVRIVSGNVLCAHDKKVSPLKSLQNLTGSINYLIFHLLLLSSLNTPDPLQYFA